MSDGRWAMSATGVELEAPGAMSKHNNVNPGQYKVGGRLHPGDDNSRQEQEKSEASIAEHELREDARRSQDKDKEEK